MAEILQEMLLLLLWRKKDGRVLHGHFADQVDRRRDDGPGRLIYTTISLRGRRESRERSDEVQRLAWGFKL